MNLNPIDTIESVNHIINHAHELCLEYDPDSDCKKYLTDKINLNISALILKMNHQWQNV